MANTEILRQVRKKIAEIILAGHMAEDEGGVSYPDKEADQILSLEIDGRYRVAVVDTKAELSTLYPEVFANGLILPNEATQKKMLEFGDHMLKEGWGKVIEG